MLERWYDGSLEGLFAILEERCQVPGSALPDRVRRKIPQEQPELFSEPVADQSAVIPIHFTPKAQSAASELYEVSMRAYTACVYGWMSELPIEAEILRFSWQLINTARITGTGSGSGEARDAAEKYITDQGNPLVKTVFGAAYKVRREIHRLMGFLRFIPNAQGIYIARCMPDHFTLPAVARHFTLRFGHIPWMVIDEKRCLCLCQRKQEEAPVLFRVNRKDWIHHESAQDQWEKLWLQYHNSINNAIRNKPALQQQFIPERYWQYLPEMTARKT